MTHLINGMAGNIESHSILDPGEATLNITAVLDDSHYGFSKLTVLNATALKWAFVRGDGSSGDELMLLKRAKGTSSSKPIMTRELASDATFLKNSPIIVTTVACLAAFVL